jgi:hypothetical protein
MANLAAGQSLEEIDFLARRRWRRALGGAGGGLGWASVRSALDLWVARRSEQRERERS